MDAFVPLLIMAAVGIALAIVYVKCRKLSPRAIRIARVVCTVALIVAFIAIGMAVALPGPANKYQYGSVTLLVRNVVGTVAALPLLLIPLWLTVLLGTLDHPVVAKIRWPALYIAIAGAVVCPIGLFASIFTGCMLAGACL